ncbi:hypothetical protein AUK10_00240 [Candidatus Gracilibacteria bacterium CG2_30_37_12]|nr:MAG: hypothetical protein AUK10_00240 [Candidatus Gracilibacteria bacterium CG2_30_37_12]
MSYFLQVYQITKETAKEYRDIFIKWFDECLKINILHFYYLKIRVFMGGKISDFCLSPGLIGSTSQGDFGYTPSRAAEIARQESIKKAKEAEELKQQQMTEARKAQFRVILGLKKS